ncbi:MAG: HAD hydrolase-like protein, partial [Candidatus Cloacimonadota bacterium]
MKAPYLLFDFDGTIANSIDLLYQIMNQFAPDYGIEHISEEDFMVIRNMSAASIIRLAGVPLYKIPFIIGRVLRVYKKRVHELEPYPGIHSMLQNLRADGIGLALLSSNSRQNVVKFLDRHRLHYFDWIEG